MPALKKRPVFTLQRLARAAVLRRQGKPRQEILEYLRKKYHPRKTLEWMEKTYLFEGLPYFRKILYADPKKAGQIFEREKQKILVRRKRSAEATRAYWNRMKRDRLRRR